LSGTIFAHGFEPGIHPRHAKAENQAIHAGQGHSISASGEIT